MALKVFKNQNYIVTPVTYTKDNGETSDRDIIVISEPIDQYKALDVTDLTVEQRHTLQAILKEHKAGLEGFLSTIPTADHKPRWKNFKQAGLQFKNGEA